MIVCRCCGLPLEYIEGQKIYCRNWPVQKSTVIDVKILNADINPDSPITKVKSMNEFPKYTEAEMRQELGKAALRIFIFTIILNIIVTILLYAIIGYVRAHWTP